jgi:hypothetical protein
MSSTTHPDTQTRLCPSGEIVAQLVSISHRTRLRHRQVASRVNHALFISLLVQPHRSHCAPHSEQCPSLHDSVPDGFSHSVVPAWNETRRGDHDSGYRKEDPSSLVASRTLLICSPVNRGRLTANCSGAFCVSSNVGC